MLIVGPDGALTEVTAFQAAAINLFQKLGAVNFFTREMPGHPPGCTSAFVGFKGWFDIACGRSPDEALLRLIERIGDKIDCTNCDRPLYVDSDNVVQPLNPSEREYLDGFMDARMTTCTLYFDHRKVEWAQSCHGFDPDFEPEQEESPEWNAAPAAGLIVPSEPTSRP